MCEKFLTLPEFVKMLTAETIQAALDAELENECKTRPFGATGARFESHPVRLGIATPMDGPARLSLFATES